MRRAALTALVLTVAATNARAQDLHLLSAGDIFTTTDGPSPGKDKYGNSLGPASGDTELGLTLQAEVRHLGRWDLKLDYRARGTVSGDFNPTRSELFELYAMAHDIGGHADFVVGRFHAPGGMWLIVDGLGLRAHMGDGAVAVFGGLRAFTTGRIETNLTSDFTALPVAGIAASYTRQTLIASAGVTFAQDRLDIHQGWLGTTCSMGKPMVDGSNITCPMGTITPGSEVLAKDSSGGPFIENDFFIDASVLAMPTPKLTLGGSFIYGTRYNIQFSALNASDANASYNVTNIDAATLGSLTANAFAEYKPIKRVRLAYLFDFDQVRVYQALTPTGAQATGGSFEDHTLKATINLFRGVRFDARYRLRFRENTDVIHRIEGALYGDDLIAGLGAFATLGIDEYGSYHVAKVDPSRYVYQAGLSFVRPWLDVRAGVLYLDTFGDCSQKLSVQINSGTNTCPTTSVLFPFVLEAQRVAFLRAFVTHNGFFVGVDGEANLDFNQFRLLGQVGYAR